MLFRSGMPSLLNQGLIPDTAKLHYSGHLSAQTRYPDGLKAILSEYFGLPVAIEEYVGQWLELPERSRVGVSANQLGVDFCLGSHVWDRQHKFRIRLGPLTLDDYMGMLPGHQPFNELVAWVAEYLGHELDWDLNLVLQQPEVPALQLNGNRVLASAAYNAGPGRVRQWLRGADHLSFDVWVESIPFDETRQYVQNVLSYSVIYGQKLNSPQPLVDWHERYFDDQ